MISLLFCSIIMQSLVLTTGGEYTNARVCYQSYWVVPFVPDPLARSPGVVPLVQPPWCGPLGGSPLGIVLLARSPLPVPFSLVPLGCGPLGTVPIRSPLCAFPYGYSPWQGPLGTVPLVPSL